MRHLIAGLFVTSLAVGSGSCGGELVGTAQGDGGHVHDAPPVGTRVPLKGDRPVVRVYRTGRPARTDSYPQLLVSDHESRGLVPESYSSGVAAPIMVASRVWGVIVTSRVGPSDPFPADAESRLAEFSDLVSLAVAGADARAELVLRATTDPLTGLANHRAFHERFDVEVERAKRHGSALSLVLLDIDGFKQVNDRHGHQVGDEVLVEVARRLRALGRSADTVARLGGDEFAWLLPETDGRNAAAAARRAWRAVRDVPFPAVGMVTASAGACALEAHGSTRSLLHGADRALYRAKAAGRDTVDAGAPEPEPQRT